AARHLAGRAPRAAPAPAARAGRPAHLPTAACRRRRAAGRPGRGLPVRREPQQPPRRARDPRRAAASGARTDRGRRGRGLLLPRPTTWIGDLAAGGRLPIPTPLGPRRRVGTGGRAARGRVERAALPRGHALARRPDRAVQERRRAPPASYGGAGGADWARRHRRRAPEEGPGPAPGAGGRALRRALAATFDGFSTPSNGGAGVGGSAAGQKGV